MVVAVPVGADAGVGPGPGVAIDAEPVLSFLERGLTLGPTGNGSGFPIDEPSE